MLRVYSLLTADALAQRKTKSTLCDRLYVKIESDFLNLLPKHTSTETTQSMHYSIFGQFPP